MLAITVSVAMSGYAIALGRHIRAWSHPAIVFAIFWALVLFFAKVGVWSVPLPPAAALYSFAAVVAFGFPVFLTQWAKPVRTAHSRAAANGMDYPLLAVFLGLQFVAVACVALNINANGFSFADVLADPLKFGADYIGARYTGQVGATIFSAVGTVANYAAAPLCGMIIANRRGYLVPGLLLLPCFVPSLLAMFIYGDKGTLFLAISLFYGGLVAGWLRGGMTGLLSRRGVVLSAVGVLILAPILFSAMVMKVVGKWDITAEILGPIWRHFNSYAFGSLYAFGDWLQDYLNAGAAYQNPEGYTFGFWTFLAVGRRVAPGYEVPDGYYSEYFTVGNEITTNIYTMFRGLIVDFGMVGSILFMVVLGAVASWAYRSSLVRHTPVSAVILVISAGATYSSYLLSVFSWGSFIAAMGLLLMILIANDAAKRSRQVSVTAPDVRTRQPAVS